MQKHIHAADAEHGVIKVETVKHLLVEMPAARIVAENFRMVITQVLPGRDEKPGRAAAGHR
jgi:hypothetical protein